VLGKARLWDRHEKLTLNDRLRRIINRLADGFDGKFTSSKWTVIAKCSPDTALRDIEDFRKRGILTKDLGGGRAIHCLSPELPKQALHTNPALALKGGPLVGGTSVPKNVIVCIKA